MNYRLKLTITISLLIAVSFGIGGTMLIATSFSSSLEKETEAALESFETVQSTLYLLNSVGGQSDYESLADALDQMAAQNVGRWQALKLQSEEDLIYLNGSEVMLQHSLPQPEENQCSYLSITDQFGHGLLVLSTITADNQRLELRARFDLSSVYATRQTQQRLYLVVYILVVLFGIAASIVLAYALTIRLHRLTTVVRKISGGNLSIRSRITSQDEFGQLSRDFDAMADKLQENISRLESEMQRQESFMGAFAHELKTPMTSIIGYADLLRTQALDPGDAQEAANYIFSEGKRLESLSLKLLQLHLAKHETPDLQTVEVSELAERLVRRLKPVYEQENVRLSCRTVPGKWEMDPELMESVLMNLMDNARKAMDKGGAILLMVEFPGETCRIRVCDNGRGMPPEVLSHLTEAFYRVDKSRSRAQGGAGLGLSLCNEIVRFHNGELKFDSQLGRGTCATVTLRRAEP